ncbi:O-antigen ligase family protein [bacterium]|nr:O-antigen ligase family protein [bacterium]
MDPNSFRHQIRIAILLGFSVFISVVYLFLFFPLREPVGIFICFTVIGFILLAYQNLKNGLYLLIFLVPLLHPFHEFLHLPGIAAGPLWVFSLLIGQLCSCLTDRTTHPTARCLDSSRLHYVSQPVFALVTLSTLSFITAVLRYTNFYPFLWQAYVNLLVNTTGVRTTQALTTISTHYSICMSGFILFYLVLRARFSMSNIYKIFNIFALATVIVVLAGIGQYLFNPVGGLDRYWWQSGRLNATLTDPNALGLYTSIVFSILMVLLFQQRSRLRLGYGFLLVLVTINMFFSGSRCAFINIGLIVIILALFFFKFRVIVGRCTGWVQSLSLLSKVFLVVSLLGAIFLSASAIRPYWDELQLEAGINDCIAIYMDSPRQKSRSTIRKGVAAKKLFPDLQEKQSMQYELARNETVTFKGWAVDQNASKGTGIEKVIVRLDSITGPQLKQLSYGNPRPDIALFFDRPDFVASGFQDQLPLNQLEQGHHRLFIIAYAWDGTYSYNSRDYYYDTRLNPVLHFYTENTEPTLFDISMDQQNFNREPFVVAKRIHADILALIRGLLGYEHGGFKLLLSGRDFLWQRAFEIFLANPLTGIGIGSFALELPYYCELAHVQAAFIDNTGNFYLQLLVELGLPGLIVFVIMFYRLLTIMFRSLPIRTTSSAVFQEKLLYTTLFANIISMLIIFNFGPHTNFFEIQFAFWLIIGLSITSSLQDEPFTTGHTSTTNVSRSHWPNLSFFAPVSQKPRLFSPKTIFAIKFFIYCTYFYISIYMSITYLSLFHKQNSGYGDNAYGFYECETNAEHSFRWTGIEASFPVTGRGSVLRIPVHVAHPDIHERPVEVVFSINYRRIKRIEIRDHDWHTVSIPVSVELGRRFTLTVSVDRTWVPARTDVGGPADYRELGVTLPCDLSRKVWIE